MNQLTIEGKINTDFTEKAVYFFCNLLGIEVPNLQIFTDDTIDVSGACYQNSQDDYMIVLREQEFGQMIVTLAHELTHVKQYILNNLEQAWDPSIPYMNRWWEQEAYRMEVELMERLIEAVEKQEI